MNEVPLETPRTPEEMRATIREWLCCNDGFTSSGSPDTVHQQIHASAYVTVNMQGHRSPECTLTWGRTRVKLLSDGTERGSYGEEQKPFTALFNDIVGVLDRTRPTRAVREPESAELGLAIGKAYASTQRTLK